MRAECLCVGSFECSEVGTECFGRNSCCVRSSGVTTHPRHPQPCFSAHLELVVVLRELAVVELLDLLEDRARDLGRATLTKVSLTEDLNSASDGTLNASPRATDVEFQGHGNRPIGLSHRRSRTMTRIRKA